jgi:ABC-type molybdate transport system substrate-binding protein
MRQPWMSWLLIVVASGSVAANERAVAAAADRTYALSGPAHRFENSTLQLKQAVAISAASKHKNTAQTFVAYMLSPEDADIFRYYGLTPPAHQ